VERTLPITVLQRKRHAKNEATEEKTFV